MMRQPQKLADLCCGYQVPTPHMRRFGKHSKPLKQILQHMHVRSILTRWHEVEKQQQTRVSLPLQQKEQVEIIFPRQGQEKN